MRTPEQPAGLGWLAQKFGNMPLAELLIKIELMPYVMNTLDSLGKSNSDLLEISQQLDVLIVEYYRVAN